MTRRISAALLAAVLSLSLLVPISAATTGVEEASQVVNALGIMVGDESGDFMLNRSVTRAEFITMALKATPNGEQIGAASTSPFSDVPYTHWAAGYVQAGVAAGLITGYTDGTFRPNQQITLAEGATIVLQLLGYTPADFSGAYPTAQMAMFNSLKLGDGVSSTNYNLPLTRRDSMYIFYNLLSAKGKTGTPYLNTLGYSLNAAGQVDRLAIINAAMDGPVVVQSGWESSIPFSTSTAKVYRAGKASTLSAIQSNDVVYWCKPMKTLWAYSEKATGAIQGLTPSSSSPSAVTVAGKTYAIETSAVAYALSDLGQYSVGDSVTLLLGRDGGVAAVAGPGIASATEVVGVVTTLGTGAYSDGVGGTYFADTVTLTATNGQSYSYEWKSSSFKVGNLVQVNTTSEGDVTLKRLSSSSTSGKVSSDGAKLGSDAFASDVEILDVYEGIAVRVYPSRLAGMSLTSSNVSWHEKNSKGEISRLILSDATGDMHHFGVMVKISDIPVDLSTSYHAYQYVLSGTPGVLPQSNTRYPVKVGPFVLKGELASPKSMTSLTSVKVGQISGNQLTASGQKYTMDDNVQVYVKDKDDYTLSTLAKVQGDDDYTLTGWYDKAESAGGRIRVIVATK